jgi:hypothetical protein
MLCCAEEAERSLHDALCVLTETVKETRVVCGGGCMEMLMAAAIDRYAQFSVAYSFLLRTWWLPAVPCICLDSGSLPWRESFHNCFESL